MQCFFGLFSTKEQSHYISQLTQFEEYADVTLGSSPQYRRLDLNNQHQKWKDSEAVGILTAAARAVPHREGEVLSYFRSCNCHKPFCSPPAWLPSS